MTSFWDALALPSWDHSAVKLKINLALDSDMLVQCIGSLCDVIYKKGDKKECNNFKGISMISTTRRLYDKILIEKKMLLNLKKKQRF